MNKQRFIAYLGYASQYFCSAAALFVLNRLTENMIFMQKITWRIAITKLFIKLEIKFDMGDIRKSEISLIQSIHNFIILHRLYEFSDKDFFSKERNQSTIS